VWRGVSAAGLSGYRIFVARPQGSAQTYDAPASATTITIPVTVQPGDMISIAVLVGGDMGPRSAALALITAAATVLSMAYAVVPAAKLTLLWQTVNQSAVAGYVAVLAEVGTPNVQTQTVTAPSAVFTATLDPAQTYQATIRAVGSGGLVQGPSTAPLTAIAAQPVLAGLDYNPDALIVSWTPIVQPAITGCEVTVALGTQQTPYPAGNGAQVTLPVTLDPTQAYAITVAATGAQGVVKGPPSAPLAPLLTGPTNPTLTYDGNAFSAGWSADHNPAVSGYIVRLLVDNAAADQKAQPASPATFSDPFTAGKVYASQVRSTGAKVQGPWTAPAPAPYHSVATLTHDGLGRLTTIARLNAPTTVFTFDAFGNIETVRSTDPAPGS
jgi:hypothetical protein